ncbi:unnamed protein product [Symbiodinium pilosum]|uniref:Uncharacterized protein n=1 Tax=Symbiodinium pilosum TaxID=2952 RepID=A0A812T703_SYMPI|nr:unnamed protein product [Symbiodinium pilosum]
MGVMLTLSYLHMWTALCICAPPTLYGGYRHYRKRTKIPAILRLKGDSSDWSKHPEEFFDINTPDAIARRRKAAEETIESVNAGAAQKFNEYATRPKLGFAFCRTL